VVQETSVQVLKSEEAQASVKTAQDKPAATESRDVTLIDAGGISTTPRGKAEQKKPQVVHHNRRIIKESRSTPEVLRSRKSTPMLETEPQRLAKFQAVTPINRIIHHHCNALANSDMNTPTLVRDVTSKDDSKKRKLVEQLEIPDTVREDRVTLLGQEIKQTAPDERERKMRRKKRAAAPIPMIPILPLSDDE
jgi:hypothetical protein